jgi:hypothetical protein
VWLLVEHSLSLHPTPWTLRTGAVLVAVQGAALAVIGLAFGIYGMVHHPVDAVTFGFVLALALIAGTGLLFAARGLVRKQRWALPPAMVVQLCGLAVRYYMLTGGAAWAGAPLGVLALGIIVLLLAPSTSRVLKD